MQWATVINKEWNFASKTSEIELLFVGRDLGPWKIEGKIMRIWRPRYTIRHLRQKLKNLETLRQKVFGSCTRIMNLEDWFVSLLLSEIVGDICHSAYKFNYPAPAITVFLYRSLTVTIHDAQSQIAHIFICQTGRFDIFICQKKFIYLGHIILKIYAQSWRNLRLRIVYCYGYGPSQSLGRSLVRSVLISL